MRLLAFVLILATASFEGAQAFLLRGGTAGPVVPAGNFTSPSGVSWTMPDGSPWTMP